jgi:homoserine O-succinyltransferase
MPVYICQPDAGANRQAERWQRETNSLDIALVNNMPDSALRATERQFLTLLEAAAQEAMVHVSFYTLPEIARSEERVSRTNNGYFGFGSLWNRQFDGLIVTGTEPSKLSLKEEPYWGSLTAVIEWAEQNTLSSVWSCLAAHAAILHVSGIPRRRLADKLSGVFQYTKTSDNVLAERLTNGISDRLWVPHSRWGDVGAPGNADELDTFGYHVLARSETGGIDSLIKRTRSLFVLLQGHPEYEADSLLLEYRRDIRRYLSGERATYPSMPRNYFGGAAIAQLKVFEEWALSDRRSELLGEFPIVRFSGGTANTWRSAAVRIYRNWLRYLREQKAEARGIRQTAARGIGESGVGERLGMSSGA